MVVVRFIPVQHQGQWWQASSDHPIPLDKENKRRKRSGMLRKIEMIQARGVHSGHRVDFRSHVSGRFKIESCVHIDYYIILNSF